MRGAYCRPRNVFFSCVLFFSFLVPLLSFLFLFFSFWFLLLFFPFFLLFPSLFLSFPLPSLPPFVLIFVLFCVGIFAISVYSCVLRPVTGRSALGFCLVLCLFSLFLLHSFFHLSSPLAGLSFPLFSLFLRWHCHHALARSMSGM